MRYILFFLATLSVSSILPNTTIGQTSILSMSDKADVARVENYLNNITTLKARFLQINAEGQIAEGNVFMRRPGRARFEYEPPAQILVVADGTWLIFHDKELDETTRLPLYSTPISVLLKKDVQLNGDVTVVSVEKEANTLRVNIIDTDEPEEGGITLVFSDRPFKLRKWLITDAQGNTTSITISDVERDMWIKPELFNLFDPNYD
ncbi:MAG: outer membrane lipoprotein carrier protein LolA [Sneathiella sp.]|nr:outer membrane lipoprotein carrier protein LolA [Sneathiella sp.]